MPVPDLPDLTPRDEKLILALLDADMSIAAVSRTEQTTLTALLRWSWQPHIRAWLAVLSDLGSLRAKALAANHSAAAVRTLLSANHLADADFYEQADPAARIRSFESGRKAAAQLLRLAGVPTCATTCATTRGPERVVRPDAQSPNDIPSPPTRATPAHPRPVSTGRSGVAEATRGVRGPSESDTRTERGVPVSEDAPNNPNPLPSPNPKSPIQNPKSLPRLTFDGRLRPRRKRPSRASPRTLARRARSRFTSFERPQRTLPPCQDSP